MKWFRLYATIILIGYFVAVPLLVHHANETNVYANVAFVLFGVLISFKLYFTKLLMK